MEGVQARVQEKINGMISEIDTKCLRRMQADMYKCSATCCENPNYRMDDVQNCIEKCSVPVNQAQVVVQEELQSFQNRLQRCAMDCQDKIRDRITADTKESEVAKLRSEMEKCVLKCADDHMNLIPSMKKRIEQGLKK